ncbi:ROK family protein [Longibaculum muris]|uniref:ROK family protein n=1 Tax=Longibaculum muris TaxID=1796628 RepID=UPI0018A00DB3|nr:ROK family protein [Longibaculum muris]
MYLVIDVGGTYTKYGYYNKEGHCFENGQFETIKTNRMAFYESLEKLVQQNTKGIALSMPGILNAQTGEMLAVTLLPFLNHHNIKEELQERTKLPVSIQNDAKCAALGEMWQGSLQNMSNAFMLVFGSGIGGTIIMNGELVDSPRHKAGEVGCLLAPETLDYSSVYNISKSDSGVALIRDLSQAIGCEPDGQIVFQKLFDHQEARQIFQAFCRRIAMLIYNLDYLFDLDAVSIGGGISAQEILISTIQEEFQKMRDLHQEDDHQPIIQACTFLNGANLLGALHHYLKTIEKS